MTRKAPANEVEFNTFNQGVFPAPGEEFMGQFVSLSHGPENEYGIPLIVTFESVRDDQVQTKSGPITLAVGELYDWWLNGTVARTAMKAAAPTEGETFAVRNAGERTSRTRKDASGNPAKYTEILIAMPGRPTVAPAKVSWSDVPD